MKEAGRSGCHRKRHLMTSPRSQIVRGQGKTSDPLSGVRESEVLPVPSDHLIGMLAQAGLLYATLKRGPLETMMQVAQHPVFGNPDTVLLVAWAIKGQLTGHEWHSCERCGGLRLITPSPAHPRLCLNTPMCAGRYRRIAKRPILSKALRHIIASDPFSWDDLPPWMSEQH